MTETLEPNSSAWFVRSLQCLLVAAFVALSPIAASAQEKPGHTPWRQLLEDAGVTVDELQAFDDWSGNLTDDQAESAAKLVFRLEQRRTFEGIRDQPPPSSPADWERGQLVTVRGRAHEIGRVRLPDATRDVLDQSDLFQCRIDSPDGSSVKVISRRAPAAWMQRSPRLLDEPVTFQGVYVGSTDDGGQAQPLFISSRIQWHPESNVPVGIAWLVEHGFDAALFDEIRHGRAFAKPHESLEGLAFYHCLAIVAGSGPDELIQLAREALPAKAGEAKGNLADATAKRQSLTKKWEAATPSEHKQMSQELNAARRRQAIAAGVVERAQRGASSVVPFFLEPQKHTGEAVLIEGTARRAIRIVLDEEASRAAQLAAANQGQGREPSSLAEYYELDVFTTDSQNLPVICCVARLPEGFPTGEMIREPVRVGGIFFKQWSYVRRADDGKTSTKNRPPERLHPPLIVAAAPQWLRTAEPATPQNRGLWAGLAFLAVFLVVVVSLVRVSRRDRLAQARQARYDSPLEDIAES